MPNYYYARFKEYYEKTFHINPERFLSPFVKWLFQGAQILDIGCGSGRDMLWLTKQDFSVTGFERSPGLASLARENSGCEVIEGDFKTYDFSILLFDALLMSGALVHVPHKSFHDTFQNIISAVKEDGIIYISLKEGHKSKSDATGRTFYLWQQNDLKEIFESFGYSILSFSRNRSATGTDEVWLGFVLKKL